MVLQWMPKPKGFSFAHPSAARLAVLQGLA
jgi:hypothetical protein